MSVPRHAYGTPRGPKILPVGGFGRLKYPISNSANTAAGVSLSGSKTSALRQKFPEKSRNPGKQWQRIVNPQNIIL
jgi:hypothetical protein